MPDADERRLGALRPFPTWPADGRSGRRPRAPAAPGGAGPEGRRGGVGGPRARFRGLVSKNSIFQGFDFERLVPSRIRNWHVFEDSIFRETRFQGFEFPKFKILENSNPWNSVSKDTNSASPAAGRQRRQRGPGRWSLVGADMSVRSRAGSRSQAPRGPGPAARSMLKIRDGIAFNLPPTPSQVRFGSSGSSVRWSDAPS